MKFGVNVINFGPDAGPRTLAGWARLGEDLGFHSAMISDHVAVTPDVGRQYEAPFYDPFTVLAWLAGTTSRIRLGTTVAIAAYRHPLQLARVTANLDHLSDGRLILGVGSGWARQEFAALGIPYERRGAITDEYLAAVRCLWSDELASFQGEFVSFTDVATAPRPTGIPLWVGGKVLRRVARFADAWHPINMPVRTLRDEGVPALRAAVEALGRPMPKLAPRIGLEITSAPLPEEDRKPGTGTLAQIRADLEVLATLGADHVIFDTYSGTPAPWTPAEEHWRTIETLTEKLIDPPAEALR